MQGTTNEPFHRQLNRAFKLAGGRRTMELLVTLQQFVMLNYNGVPSVKPLLTNSQTQSTCTCNALGCRIANAAVWIISELRCVHAANKLRRDSGVDSILSTLGQRAQAVPSPWKPAVPQTAVWLQEQGFRPKGRVDPAWTPAEKLLLENALADLCAGERNKPGEDMTTEHFISHHIMELRHDKESCKRMMKKLLGEYGLDGQFAAACTGNDDGASDVGSGGDTDSDDELQLGAELAA